ncbi:MAG TPA: hypothetical protein VGB82_08165 [Alphaproteobacteria bacterium]
MSDRDDELTLIEKRLFKLPPAKFRQIVAVLEDRRPELGGRGPVEALMSKMRPRLVRMRLARKLTLQRVFCRPFEELLTDEADPKSIGTRLSRQSIDPCWRVFVDNADVKRLQKLAANLRACGEEDGRRVERIGRQLWAYAAEVLRATLRPERGGMLALAHVPERACQDVLFIVDYLEVADVLQELKRRLGPRPLRRTTDEHIDAIQTAFEAVNEVNRQHQHVVIDLLLVWLKRPSDIVAIVDRIAVVAQAEIDEASLSLAGESLVEDIEDKLRSVTGLAETASEHRSRVVRQLRGCISDLIGAHGAFQNRSSVTAMRRLERIRTKVATLVEDHVLRDADGRILGAVPEPPTAAADHALSNVLPVLLLGEPPDSARVEAAEDQAIALRLCVKYAEELGLKGAFFDKIESLGRAIEDRARWAARQIALEALSDAGREAVASHFYVAVRMLELVAGSDRADNLRRHLLAPA